MSNTPKSSRDHLTATTQDGTIELAEEELSRVTGGTAKFKFTATTKDKVDTFLAYELTS
jgi:hypothetical protein